MVVITIDTENGNKVSFSEQKDGSTIGGSMTFDNFNEVKDVTLEDVLAVRRNVFLANQIPFGEKLLTGKQMFREQVYGRKQNELLALFKKVLPDM